MLSSGGWDGSPATRIRQRNLPHWEVAGACYFVTFRLANSLPSAVAREWLEERASLRELQRLGEVSEAELQIRVRRLNEKFDAQLDRGETGPLYLREPPIAELVTASLHHYHGARYLLGPYVLMPNHVHLILRPLPAPDGPAFGLDTILQGIKGFTARGANALLKRRGAFWQREYYDHVVRDRKEWIALAEYILGNPVAAQLCRTPNDWPWSNARYF